MPFIDLSMSTAVIVVLFVGREFLAGFIHAAAQGAWAAIRARLRRRARRPMEARNGR